MAITGIVAQLRTTHMASSIRFCTEKLGFSVEFKYRDFYTGIRAGDQIFHLELVDDKDPSIASVVEGEHFAPTDCHRTESGQGTSVTETAAPVGRWNEIDPRPIALIRKRYINSGRLAD